MESYSYKPVTALLRGLVVLQCINVNGPQSVGDIHKQTGISKPTIVRLLETFIFAGYIRRDKKTSLYNVTARVLSLSNGYDLSLDLLNAAIPHINAARQQWNWPIEIGVFDQDAMIILDTSRQLGAFSVNRKPGSRVSLFNTALGRAYLSALSDKQITDILTSLSTKPNTELNFAHNLNELMDIVNTVRSDGYSIADRETLTNGRALAVAILHNNKPIASINIIVHTSAFTVNQLRADVSPFMIDLAKQISSSIYSD